MVDPPGRVLIHAVQGNRLQGCLYIISWEHGVPLQSVRIAFPPLSVRRTQAELKNGLETSPEILIEEAIDDGVDAAVEEGQPVGEGVDVNVDNSVLLLRQARVVTQHH